MKLLCLTKYPEKGPSSRYRVHQFLPFLADAGIDVDVQSLHSESYLDGRYAGRRTGLTYLVGRLARRLLKLTAVKHYHAVFIQKEMFPYVPGVVESLLANMGVRIILDVDDAIYLYYDQATGWRRRLLANKIPRVMSRASLILAGNGHLARYASRYSTHVVTFPTVVDTERFTPDTGGPNHPPVIGWMGTPQTSAYLNNIVPALETVARSHPFTLFVVGADAPSVNGVTTASRPWAEATEVDDLRKMDIGVMPLPDEAWSDGKCALKLLQYMSCGVASVSTPRGSVTDIVEDGANGLLATTVDEWADRLTCLLESASIRREIAARGRTTVAAKYALNVHGPRLAAYIRDVGEGREVSGEERSDEIAGRTAGE